MSDEMIFYIGLVICGISAISMIIYLVTSRIKLIKLNNKLDEEYGKEKIKLKKPKEQKDEFVGKVIDSTYEVLNRLDVDKGRVVYIANHLKLNKKVVVKIYKRSMRVSPKVLKREIHNVKSINHKYIQRVYDCFVGDGVMCIVTDFIKGERLDKLLKKGVRFSNRQVVEWACQILEALDYLHHINRDTENCGYIHGAIKPRNIILKPDNSVCLVDINIALALGDTSVISSTPGYASPEHYGEKFSSEDISVSSQSFSSKSFDKKLVLGQIDEKQQCVGAKNEMLNLTKDEKLTGLVNHRNTITEFLYSSDKTEPLSDSQTTINLVDDNSCLPHIDDPESSTNIIADNSKSHLLQDLQKSNNNSLSTQSVRSDFNTITPCIQSDIYSLGATLYHLFSGIRPPQDARLVVPLSTKIVSKQISDIISKAMNPDVTLRYQSAIEMLSELRGLKKNKKRMIRFNKMI